MRKPTTASVGAGNLEAAKSGLKERQKKGLIPTSDSVLSISDHGDVLMVYTESTSFGMVKPKKGKTENASTGETG